MLQVGPYISGSFNGAPCLSFPPMLWQLYGNSCLSLFRPQRFVHRVVSTMSGKQASCESLSSAHRFPSCRTLMVTPYFQDLRPFLLKWKPAVFILFHTVYLQNLRLILIIVDLRVTLGYCILIVTEM